MPSERRKGSAKYDRIEQLNTLHWVIDNNQVDGWDLAIDGGANVGDWSIIMARYFRKVIGFEPSPDTFNIYSNNTAGIENITRINLALWKAPGKCNVENPPKRSTNSATFIVPGRGALEMIALDHTPLEACNLLKLDLEGAETDALIGGERTVKKFKPTLIVEMNKTARNFNRKPQHTRALVESWGYQEIFNQGDDFVFRHKDTLCDNS